MEPVLAHIEAHIAEPLSLERLAAVTGLRQGVPVASVASESGFCDQSHLARRFKRECGMTPTQYQCESRDGS